MTVEFKDYHDILGVKPSASAEEIKRAYKKLARRYHPDVSKEPDAQAKFQDVSDAYDNLKNEDKRAEYDQLRAYVRGEGQHFHSDPNVSFDDLLNSIFGHPFDGFGDFHGHQPQDVHHTLQITLEEAYNGGSRQLRYQNRDSEKTINVSIPKSIREGQKLRLAGQGETVPDGQPSDLYLQITFAPHSRFTTDGKDICFMLEVTPWQAALGASVEIPTLGGPVNLKVPENSQTGRRLRLKGRGLGNGDQFVELKIVNPRIDSDKHRQAFEQLRSEFNT
tara:strand:- start:2299 stop:3129 length:831 start_codon:yes stop_codon:yes gene_type:complete